MQLTNTLLLTLSAATFSLGLAVPQPGVAAASSEAGPVLDARFSYPYVKHRVRYCEHANGGGACQNQDLEAKRCYNFPGWWDNRISSVYVNPGYKCYLYDGVACQGLRKEEVKMPGITDLKSRFLNDRASSIYCTL
ncbi:beta gamma crystallin protein [Diplodia corticola]|uniref:Beta gamma crystallin protein n=1 Tax=Diplodia corticola TaxID=236234 RepID=A0A1J9QUG7_9PEZI|nr:beta gamma crystallin protein [Diplodia corticola]OJD32049.1 beta gamma crystallin protein [Diplodia corticola]